LKKSRSATASRLYSPRTTLAALGLKLRSLGLFEVIAGHVQIRQKSIKHTPIEKLQDAFIAILAGAHGLAEVNTKVRPDAALQRAFGRKSCAEQSVVQETLSACTAKNVVEMRAALAEIFRAHSAAYRHDYEGELQVLDADLSGLPCGKRAEAATKGYFSQPRARYGRQLGRVVAAQYEEVVADQVYPGNVQLSTTLPHLVEEAEQTLGLDEARRQRTVLRIDAGGGSMNGINWLLRRGYHVHCKDFSTRRAAHFALSVEEWHDDPRRAGRQLGWALVKEGDYARPVRRLAIRWRRRNGQRCHALLISTLEAADVLRLVGRPLEQLADPRAVLAAYAELYDRRGGTVEIELKESKQGVGLAKRNKKSYTGQQMVVLLSALAHNCLVWARRWLVERAPKLKRYGVQRLVRDVFQVGGQVELEGKNTVKRIVLNEASALARHCAKSLRALLKQEHVRVILGKT
jgi:Transposase DDE domain group 1